MTFSGNILSTYYGNKQTFDINSYELKYTVILCNIVTVFYSKPHFSYLQYIKNITVY